MPWGNYSNLSKLNRYNFSSLFRANEELFVVKFFHYYKYQSTNSSNQRINFSLQDSIEITRLHKNHGGNAEKIIIEMHKLHRINFYHDPWFFDDVSCYWSANLLLKKSHTVWDAYIPHFKASSKQTTGQNRGCANSQSDSRLNGTRIFGAKGAGTTA